MTVLWTIAYRKPTANRFLRVDLALTWQEATDLGGRVAEAMPGHQVWTVPTAAYDTAHPASEDAGNVLTDTGRRVKIVEGGELPAGMGTGTEPVSLHKAPAITADGPRDPRAVPFGALISARRWECIEDVHGHGTATLMPFAHAVVIAEAGEPGELPQGERAMVWYFDDARGPVNGVTVQPLWLDAEYVIISTDPRTVGAQVLEAARAATCPDGPAGAVFVALGARLEGLQA